MVAPPGRHKDRSHGCTRGGKGDATECNDGGAGMAGSQNQNDYRSSCEEPPSCSNCGGDTFDASELVVGAYCVASCSFVAEQLLYPSHGCIDGNHDAGSPSENHTAEYGSGGSVQIGV